MEIVRDIAAFQRDVMKNPQNYQNHNPWNDPEKGLPHRPVRQKYVPPESIEISR